MSRTPTRITGSSKATGALSVAVPVLLAAAVNFVLYAKGSIGQRSSASTSSAAQAAAYRKLLPPGWAIAVIWTLIFGLLGYAHYRCFPSVASFAIAVTLAFALAYPFLTQGLQVSRRAKILNTVTLILAAVTMALVVGHGIDRSVDTRAILATAPLLVWASYVNIVDAIGCSS